MQMDRCIVRSMTTLRSYSLIPLFCLLAACGKGATPSATSVGEPSNVGSSEVESAPAMAPVEGNPFVGVELFVPPYTNADQARRRLMRDDPAQGELIARIADTPQARWFGEWSGEIETVSMNYVKAANSKGKVPLLVAYYVPNRDCGQYSSGGAADPEAYKNWIRGLARGISDSRRAIVILEPDALPHLTECLSDDDQAQRLELVRFAVDTLEALPGVSVYIDAGHSAWIEAPEMAKRLKRAGVDKARGFSLNVSNYISDDELTTYGDELVKLLGGDTHYVIDSSRNGNGPTDDKQWCNPEGRALGRAPTTDTGNPNLDAFIWVKNPGESDGECNGGPPAGQWFHERALEMARNAER